MCVEKSVQMFVKLGRENPHLFDWIEKEMTQNKKLNNNILPKNKPLIRLQNYAKWLVNANFYLFIYLVLLNKVY